jgi:hypothetical protein
VSAAGAAALGLLTLGCGAGAARAATPCLAATPLPGPGSAAPFRPPETRATELNAAGKSLYREGKWEEARAQYRAASAADPDFLAPRLNVACSFVRQERFREATAEVVALIERAYVPWAREVLEAADLGALKVRPEMAEITRALAGAAARWGGDLDDGLLYVARQRPALRIPPEGAGVFILNPHQEIWAFTPSTGRYRQLTAEEGHVLALARAPNGRSIAYVTAEKLVRGTSPANVALRGVVVHQLALATMALGPPARIDGDVRRLEISSPGAAGGFVLRIEGDRQSRAFALEASGSLRPWPQAGRVGAPLVVLTGRGAAPGGVRRFGGGCPLVAREAAGSGGIPIVVVGPPAGKPRPIESGAAAGLAGLPIP